MSSYAKLKYPHLFSPLTIRGKILKNRVVSSPHSGGPNLYQAGKDGASNFTETAAAYFGNIARGGAAIVNTGHLGVDPRFYLGSNNEYFNFYDMDHIHEHQLAIMHQMTDLIHSYGALASIELNHPGHYGTPVGEQKLLGPVAKIMPDGKEIEAMDEEEMNRVADYFATAAWIGKRGGFDIINVHGGHNWLIGEFLSPIENTRTDEYGGCVENRVKFPIMILDRIREKIGEDMIISMRYSMLEDAPGGITLDDSIKTVQLLQDHVDIVHCSRGMIHSQFTDGRTYPMPFMEHGCNVKYAREIRKNVTCKIEGIGAINEPEMAEKFIAEGYTDLVAMARSIIADPNWAEKARSGHPEDIRPCIRCLRCLNYANTPRTGTSICSVNPRRIFPHPLPPVTPANVIKNVAIIGGGPAGMQAAYEIALNGHNVTLFEKSDRLGGRLVFADYCDFKYDLKRYRDYLITQVRKQKNITVKLNSEVNADYIRSCNFDSVVVAIGAENAVPPIHGISQDNVMISDAVFGNEDKLGNKIVIIGGGRIGCELTVHLQAMGKEIDVIEMTDDLMREGYDTPEERYWTIYYMTHEYDYYNDKVETYKEVDRVHIHLSSRCTKIDGNSVSIIDAKGNEQQIQADNIILATGFKINESVRDSYYDTAYNVIPVGDCLKVGNILGTSSTGYYASLRV